MNRARQVRLQQAQHVVATPVDEELVLYDPQRDRVHVLNGTAAIIWRLCDGTRNRAAIAKEVSSYFRLDGRQVLSDVSDLLAQFREASLVE